MKRRHAFVWITIALLFGVLFGTIINDRELLYNKHTKYIYYKLLKDLDVSYGPWSIGIYEGNTPFELTDPDSVSNPVITGEDIVDLDAVYVADPFMVFADGKFFMFFEVKNRKTKQSEIAYAESEDGINWTYKQVVIDEDFHLSYPYIFEWNNDYYLIPESNEDLSVRLYKASSFPNKWEYMGNLLSGYPFIDPSIFRYKDMWWLFVANPQNDILNLYYSEDLLTQWRPHPKNPIVKFDKNIARPGGRVFKYNNKIYRLAQDDFPIYGVQVFAIEITELSVDTYAEKIDLERPVVKMTGKGWNAVGMHNVDLYKLSDRWIAVVDGRNR